MVGEPRRQGGPTAKNTSMEGGRRVLLKQVGPQQHAGGQDLIQGKPPAQDVKNLGIANEGAAQEAHGALGVKRKHAVVEDPGSDTNMQKGAAVKRKRVCEDEFSGSVDAGLDFEQLQNGTLSLPRFRERFRNFFLARALDIIGDNTFRRFMLKHKNAEVPWAVEMHRDVQYVQQILRSTIRSVQQLQLHPLAAKLHTICQRVTNDTHPPQIYTDGCALCALTGTYTERTVVLSAGARSERLHTHRKFFKFLSMLWIVTHLEANVRSVVHHWLRGDTSEPRDLQALATRFRGAVDLHESAAKCFVHSIAHVSVSIHKHVQMLTRGVSLIDEVAPKNNAVSKRTPKENKK